MFLESLNHPVICRFKDTEGKMYYVSFTDILNKVQELMPVVLSTANMHATMDGGKPFSDVTHPLYGTGHWLPEMLKVAMTSSLMIINRYNPDQTRIMDAVTKVDASQLNTVITFSNLAMVPFVLPQEVWERTSNSNLLGYFINSREDAISPLDNRKARTLFDQYIMRSGSGLTVIPLKGFVEQVSKVHLSKDLETASVKDRWEINAAMEELYERGLIELVYCEMGGNKHAPEHEWALTMGKQCARWIKEFIEIYNK